MLRFPVADLPRFPSKRSRSTETAASLEGLTLKTRDIILGHLETIDEAWGKAKPFAVSDYVAGLATMSANDLALLLAADLEWRWRSVPPSCSQLPTDRVEAVPLCGQSPAIVEDYLAAFPKILESISAITTLVESEFIVRSRWHTPPLIDAFARRFASLLPELSGLLVNALDGMNALKIRRLNAPKHAASVSVRSGVVLGRSTEKTVSPPYYDLAKNMLFVVGCDDKTFSRSQLRIERIAYDQVRLFNLSQSIGFLAGRRLVSPGEQFSDYLPLKLTCANLRLAVELSASHHPF